MTLLTTTQAADELGISLRGVQKMIERGKLRTTRIGRDHLVSPADVDRAKSRPKAGRPIAQLRPIPSER
jgi:excisionase family DNA binding protein